MRARPVLGLLLVLGLTVACGEAEPDVPGVRFEEVPEHVGEAVLTVPDLPPARARLALLDAWNARRDHPTLAGEGPWTTVAVVMRGEEVADAVAAGRTYVRRGDSGLRLDVRLGAGDRGGFAGEVVPMGAERAMVQVRLDDPRTLEARFRIHVVADDGPGRGHPREVTPRYLARPLPKGRYRAWVDVPPDGGRFLVGVTTQSGRGEVTGHAWASPIAVERPWLQ